MLQNKLFQLLTFLLIIFLVSCAHSHDITGRWQEPGTTSEIAFRQDGTFRAVDSMGMAVSGSYILLPENRLRFEIRHPDSQIEVITGDITIQADELIMVNGKDNEVLRYKKIR